MDMPRTQDQFDLLNGLTMMRKMRRDEQGKEMDAAGFFYQGNEDLVVQHGRFYEPCPLPKLLLPGAPKSCFANAMFLAASRGFDYIEGYATLPTGPVFEHAWNADEQGRLVDNTWMNKGVAYMGVAFSVARAFEAIWVNDGSVLRAEPDYPLLCQRWKGESEDMHAVPEPLGKLLGWLGTERMATPQQLQVLVRMYAAAKEAGHIFPEAAACEAVDETNWGTSELFLRGNNIFGCKQHMHPLYGTVVLPTREFFSGNWVTVNAPFVAYPTLQASFADRMATLVRLAPSYPHYRAALASKTPQGYLVEVSQSWATNPRRAIDCIYILTAHEPLLTSGVILDKA